MVTKQSYGRTESGDQTADAVLKAKAERRLSITALVCTLNEEESLPHVLPRIPDWVDEVLLVDGHSTDRTVEIAKRLKPDIRVVSQPGKGKGDALRYGVRQATGDIIVTLDGDGETDPEEIDRFIQPLLQGYDFAKGSRFVSGWHSKPLHRIFGNWLIVATFNILYGTRYTDLCSGYNAFWKNIVDQVNLWSEDEWNYEPLLISRIHKAALKVIEIPQRPGRRLSGRSKLPNWKQGFTAIKTVVRERFRR
jgi:glycosyltransferase involved in cell wall biosynthesis